MKKILISTVLALAATVAIAQTGGITPSGIQLTRKGTNLTLEMTVAVSPDAVPRLQSVELVPVLSDDKGHSVGFPGVVVNGRDRIRIYQRNEKLGYGSDDPTRPFQVVNLWRGNSGATVAYSVAAAHEEWMDDASLSLVYMLISPAGEHHSYSSPVATSLSK